MNVKTKINLLIARVQGKISKSDAQILEAILSTTVAGSYQFSSFTMTTANRKELDQPLMAVVNKRMAVTEDGIKLIDIPEAKEIMTIIVEWNKIQKEKYASRYKEVRGSHLRGRNDKDNDNSN